MPTVVISEWVHIRDNWGSSLDSTSYSISEWVHLHDTIDPDIDSGDLVIKYISEWVHLHDTLNRYLDVPGGFNINETVHLRDSYTRLVDSGGVKKFISEWVHLHDEYETEIIQNIVFIRNENISFGETKEPGYKEYSHRFRWTNYNGVAIPDLNYKDLKEPIVRMMPAPSFLQFEYANSFLLFTRNTINRFILTPDVETGQWRARTDNLIEEFKDLGLMAPKTLILAGDTLFGLSEKGVWKWNKKGMELISDKIIDLPDAGTYEYIAFYSSIRNQYVLHRQESSGTYLRLESGTPVAPPIGFVTTSMADAKTVFLTDTKFAVLRFEDSVQHYLLIGEVDNNSIIYGTNSPDLFGKQYAQRSMLSMDNGNSVIYTYDSSGVPRSVQAATISGLTTSLGTPINVASGDYDGGVMIKFTETTFACITHANGAYQTGSISGKTISLNSGQSSGISFSKMKSIYIGNGISVIAYFYYGQNIFVRTVEDNGDGTINLGTALNTTITVASGGEIDLKAASSTLLLLVASTTNDLKTVPLTLDGTTLTKGTIKTKTDYFDNTNMNLAIANKGPNGMWLFFEDARNSGYLTAMWASVSPTGIVMAESIVKVIQNELSQSIEAAAIVGGKALLHYNEGNSITDDGYSLIMGLEYAKIDSFVYQIDRDKWGKFLGMDILDIPVILSGGSLDENYNLWLDSDRELKKYPGTAYTAVEAMIRTKEFYIEKGAFQRWMVDFEGSDVDVETRVHKMVSGSKTSEEDIKYNVTSNKFRGISLDKQRGYEMSIKIIDADILKGLSFDSKKWGEN